MLIPKPISRNNVWIDRYYDIVLRSLKVSICTLCLLLTVECLPCWCWEPFIGCKTCPILLREKSNSFYSFVISNRSKWFWRLVLVIAQLVDFHEALTAVLGVWIANVSSPVEMTLVRANDVSSTGKGTFTIETPSSAVRTIWKPTI